MLALSRRWSHEKTIALLFTSKHHTEEITQAFHAGISSTAVTDTSLLSAYLHTVGAGQREPELDEHMARALSSKATFLTDFWISRAAFSVVLRKFRHWRALGVCTMLKFSPPA